jgi:signal transduction histidine kinase
MRRRLVYVVAGVASVALVLLAVPLGIALKHSYRDDELLRLQRDTVASTRAIDLGGRASDPLELPASGDSLTVYDDSGKVVAANGAPRSSPLVGEALRSGRIVERAGDGTLQAAVPLLAGERVAGAVLAQRDDAVVDTRATHAWLAIAGLAAAIIGLAVGAAALAARRLAAPLERLGAVAGRLGEGDFSVRAPTSGVAEADAVARALNATAQRLGDTVAREREFSADASHQLRTPLAALRLELEGIELDAPSAEITRALAEVDRLDRTISTLLAAARDAPRDGGSADLDRALREIEERWRGPLAQAGRPLRIRRDAGGRSAQVSEAVLAEVMQALVDNAATHGAGEVTVAVRAVHGALAIDVADEGSGFGEDPERSFERRSGSGDGHGIGLTLARSLIRSEGGELTISRPGEHPVVTLLLPAA